MQHTNSELRWGRPEFSCDVVATNNIVRKIDPSACQEDHRHIGTKVRVAQRRSAIACGGRHHLPACLSLVSWGDRYQNHMVTHIGIQTAKYITYLFSRVFFTFRGEGKHQSHGSKNLSKDPPTRAPSIGTTKRTSGPSVSSPFLLTSTIASRRPLVTKSVRLPQPTTHTNSPCFPLEIIAKQSTMSETKPLVGSNVDAEMFRRLKAYQP